MVITIKRPDHRDIAEEPFFRKCRHNFGKDAKSGQDEDVHFRMTPRPDEVDVHHRVAAAAGR